MRHAVRVAAFLTTLTLIVSACASSSATPTNSPGGPTPSPTPTAPAKPGATPTSNATAKPTAAPTPTPKPTATPTAITTPKPTPSPTPVRGVDLLYKASVATSGGSMPQIWVVKTDGTGKLKIADGPDEPMIDPPTHDIDASWSHDGSTIHVVKYATGTSLATYCMPQITNYSVDGGPGHHVNATLSNQDDNFMWSPDDTKIYFRHWVGQPDCVQNTVDDTTKLMVMNSNGTGRHTIATNITYDIVGLTSDGSSLIGVDKNTYQAVLVNPANGHATPIGPSSPGSATVSPNGKGVAFVLSDRLHVVNSNGTGAIDLSAPPATDYGPVWSPNATKIALQRTTGSTLKIDVITLPSPTPTVIESTSAGMMGDPCWSPNGARIAMSINGGPLVVVNSNGTGAVSVPGVTSVQLLSWQPQ